MSNSQSILSWVSMRCSNEVRPHRQWHRHVTLINGKAKDCEKYPPLLVERILRGLKDQLRESGGMNSFGVGVVCEEAGTPADFEHDDSEPDI